MTTTDKNIWLRHNRRLSVAGRCLSVALAFVLSLNSCREILEPPPVDLLVDELVLNSAADIEPVRLGLYNAFRSVAAPAIIAGDFTADFIQHNGTFAVYNELGNKQITATNAAAEALWQNIYNTVYVANFIEERIAEVPGVTEANRKRTLAEVRFIRGYVNFIGAYTYGDIPKVTTTNVLTNRSVGKSPRAEILQSVLADYTAALPDLPATNSNKTLAKTFATQNAARAALARYYLYQKDWAQAEKFATDVIDTKLQTIVPNYVDVISQEVDDETILEVAYANNSSDDPGTSTFGLNNILVGRREVIPANSFVLTMVQDPNVGERRQTIDFEPLDQGGSDNGWSVVKYGTPDQANNNITIFRLAEMYLIRAEARVQQGRLVGANGAQADINILRTAGQSPAGEPHHAIRSFADHREGACVRTFVRGAPLVRLEAHGPGSTSHDRLLPQLERQV